MGPESINIGQYGPKQTISQKKYSDQNLRNLCSKQINFLFVDHLAVLRVKLNASRRPEFTRVIYSKNQISTKI